MKSYIEDKKKLYTSILKFLEESDEHKDDKSKNESIQEIIRAQRIEGDEEEMRQFLEIIKSIGEHHHRDQHFNERMNQLLFQYKDQIKQTLSNSEIFHIFENNKKIVLFLIKKDIITISEEIYEEIMSKFENNGNRYWHFFIPELENFVGEEKMKLVKNELLKKDATFFTNYEEKREAGENESHICSLIRQDSIEDFIKYLKSQNISPSSEILPSVFETNPFLIDNKNTTLIEYSAFFGSIQIFQYLLKNNFEVKSSVLLYAIHSNNKEIIHIIESEKIPPPIDDDDSCKLFDLCLIESVKCHHNEIVDYIENHLSDQNEKYFQQNEKIISNCIKYHNYSHFQYEGIYEYGFFYLSFYHYNKLFELLLKEKEESIEEKAAQYQNNQEAANINDAEVTYFLLSGKSGK